MGFTFGPYPNDTLDREFLETAITPQDEDSAAFTVIQNELAEEWNKEDARSGAIWTLNIAWYERALLQIYSSCIGPEIFTIGLENLHRTSNCSTSAVFITELKKNIAGLPDPDSIKY